MRMYYAIRIVLAMALASAAWISFGSARADFEFRRGTPESVARAVALAPGNTEYAEFRALQLDYDGADSTALLERAAALNPMSSTPRIRLGLAAEVRGDSASEKWLLDAARVDRQFEPRWTLASYYFRRGMAGDFWRWMREALEISYGDRRPAFDLCWRMSDDGAAILRQAIPDRREVLAAYIDYLLETRRVAALEEPALKLAAAHDTGDQNVLLAACDALIAGHRAGEAWDLWRAMGFAEVSFDAPRVGRGFDWRLVETAGVTHLHIDQPRSMHRVQLSGNQPESCDLLRRAVRLEAGQHYTLRWQVQPALSGVEWRIGDRSAALKDGAMEFTASSDLETLVLGYRRPSGEVRAEGSFEIWAIGLSH